MSKRPISLLAVGDIMLGDSPYCFGHGVASMIERYSPDFPFEHVSSILCEGDIVIGNLEIVASRHNRATDPFSAIEYRAQPEAINGISNSGFHILSAATNHTMEHGKKALAETLNLLDQHSIQYSGVDIPKQNVKRFCFRNIDGRRFCFVGYNFRPQQYFVDEPPWPIPDADLIISDLEQLQKEADIIIVSLHWGDEFITYPSPEQVEIAHRLIDNGANIILGHHSHIVQGIERYNNGIIAYSLGNFVFDFWQARLCKTMILKVTITQDNSLQHEIIPVLINSQHQPVVQTGEAGSNLKNELDALSEKIGKNDSNIYCAELEHNFRTFRNEIYKYYLANFFRYKPKHLFANIMGALKKRV